MSEVTGGAGGPEQRAAEPAGSSQSAGSPPSAAGEAREAAVLAHAFAALNEYLHAGGTQPDALQRLVRLAVASVPGCEWAGITRWPDRLEPRTLATSSVVAEQADALQYRTGEGPCLTAAQEGSETAQIADFGSDEQWPRYTAAVTAAGLPVRTVLSFHLAGAPQRTALNLYGSTSGAFDAASVATGALFATHARVLLVHADSADRTANLNRALSTSRQIGTAVGILMATHKITEDQAFAMLREVSQHLNRKLRDVAADVTQSGALPDAPKPDGPSRHRS